MTFKHHFSSVLVSPNMPKIYIHKNMGKTLQYETEDFKKAVKGVKMEHCDQESCKMHHHVPKSTNADRVRLNSKLGRKPALPKVVDDKIVENSRKEWYGVSRKIY